VSLEIQFTRAGIHLPQLGLWLDARKRQRGIERVFVSHAHADHIGAHDEVLLTEGTALFMRTRLPGSGGANITWNSARAPNFNLNSETFHLTALPAGHILGSAMAFIEWRDETLLYTGDFKLRPSLAAESPEACRADRLAHHGNHVRLCRAINFRRKKPCAGTLRKVLSRKLLPLARRRCCLVIRLARARKFCAA
jgi:Cft2 family RNA processing exonuclease